VTILELTCHPLPSSFSHALAVHAREALASRGHRVVFHDLYAEGFDPVLPPDELSRGFSFDERVLAHQEDLSGADGLLVVHPDWWGQPPALLKGWLDRVLRPGVAYEFEGGDFEEKRRVRLLEGLTGLVVCTSDAEETRSREALRELWEDSVLGWCGIRSSCVVFAPVHRSDPARRTAWMRELDARLASTFAADSGA
jgi:putative NADPH-quinone reductase